MICYDFYVKLIYYSVNMIIISDICLMREKVLSGLCIVVLLINAHSFLLKESHQTQPQKVLLRNPPNEDGGLQFRDTTGYGVTEAHLITFKNAINSASSFYRDNDEKRLKYIADQMDQAYPAEGRKFAIYQDAVYDGGYRIFISDDSTYAAVAPGVDRIFPKRSYFFNRYDAVGRNPSFFPISGAKGEGITEEIEKYLLNAVSQADNLDHCECQISMKSFMYPLATWNYLCYTNSADVMYYLYASEDQYYSLKGKNCYFAMFK